MSHDVTDSEIFASGTPILMIAGPRSSTIEDWVQKIASETKTRTDWRLIGGRAIVLTLGDAAACSEVLACCYRSWESLVDAYMGCGDNFVRNLERSDVTRSPL